MWSLKGLHRRKDVEAKRQTDKGQGLCVYFLHPVMFL